MRLRGHIRSAGGRTPACPWGEVQDRIAKEPSDPTPNPKPEGESPDRTARLERFARESRESRDATAENRM